MASGQVKNSAQPAWGEELHFPLPGGKEAAEELSIRVMDKDRSRRGARARLGRGRSR